MHINSVEAAQSGNKTVLLYFFVRINYWNAMISFGKYRRIRYNCKTRMASIIVPILTKSEYLVSLYMVITTRSRITNKNRIYVSEEYIL